MKSLLICLVISSLVLAEELVPLPLVLPRAAFAGTPMVDEEDPAFADVEDVPTIAQYRAALPKVPQSTKQLALNKIVTASSSVYSQSLKLVTDGQKEAYEDTSVELRPRTQWIQIDLGESKNIYSIVIWHFHLEPVIFHDVIVQVSNDPEFSSGVITLFNNDKDNSSKLGVGTNSEYWETNLGKIVDGKCSSCRYIRCYSKGSTYSDPLNRYTEVEIWGE